MTIDIDILCKYQDILMMPNQYQSYVKGRRINIRTLEGEFISNNFLGDLLCSSIWNLLTTETRS